ncbi:MAG TPA: hypothetical protein VH880_13660 [Anaeromyxobacteraceae bacterium]|jgi:hypothetical protein
MASSRRTATRAAARSGRPERKGEGGVDPAFQRAILKIALELRKPGARSHGAVIEETIRAMRLDGAAFRRYLGENGARNMSLLLAAARRFGP